MRVFVYRNINKKCLSVRDVKTGLVIAYVDEITLINVRFKVSEAGRKRVLKERCKNVHAGVEGEWLKTAKAPNLNKSTRIIYNPYKYKTFVKANTIEPQYESPRAFVTIQGVFI